MRRAESLRDLVDAFEAGQPPEEFGPRMADLRESERSVLNAWIVATYAKSHGIATMSKLLGGTSAGEEFMSSMRSRGWVTPEGLAAFDRLPRADACVLIALALAMHAREFGFEAAVALVEKGKR